MGAVAGAWRTQSSYPAFLRSTNPSDLVVPTAVYGFTSPTSGYDPVILRKIAALPHVKHLETYSSVNNALLLANGKEFPPPKGAPAGFELGTIGSNALYVDQDRVGDPPGVACSTPRRNEMLLSPRVAEVLGIHLGEVLHFGFYTNAQEAAPGPSGDQFRPHPHLELAIKVVGFGEYNNSIVQDDVDAVGSNFAMFTPALTRQLVGCCAQTTTAGLQLDRGRRDVAAVESEFQRLNPLLASHVYVSSIDATKVERAIEPESIALGVFGLIAALAALMIVGQVIGRHLRAGSDELDVLRALGARPAMTTIDGLVGVIGAIVGGGALAVIVAVALSPIAPIGAVRSVYPSRGISFDWTVLGLGALALIVILAAIAFGLACARCASPRGSARQARGRKPIAIHWRSGHGPAPGTDRNRGAARARAGIRA